MKQSCKSSGNPFLSLLGLSWPSLGHLFAPLGTLRGLSWTSWGPFGSLLGTSGRPFWRLWKLWGAAQSVDSDKVVLFFPICSYFFSKVTPKAPEKLQKGTPKWSKIVTISLLRWVTFFGQFLDDFFINFSLIFVALIYSVKVLQQSRQQRSLEKRHLEKTVIFLGKTMVL